MEQALHKVLNIRVVLYFTKKEFSYGDNLTCCLVLLTRVQINIERVLPIYNYTLVLIKILLLYQDYKMKSLND